LVSCEGYGSDGTCDGEGVNPLGVSCCYLYWGWSSIIFCRNMKHLHKGVCSFWSHEACLNQGWMLWRGAEVGFEPRISGGRDSLVEECEVVVMSNQGVKPGYV